MFDSVWLTCNIVKNVVGLANSRGGSSGRGGRKPVLGLSAFDCFPNSEGRSLLPTPHILFSHQPPLRVFRTSTLKMSPKRLA